MGQMLRAEPVTIKHQINYLAYHRCRGTEPPTISFECQVAMGANVMALILEIAITVFIVLGTGAVRNEDALS